MLEVNHPQITGIKSLSVAILIFAISALVFSQYGFEGTLVRDDANYVYSGQQMAQGMPPYKSIFDYKGPLAPMLSGLGAYLAELIHIDDILMVRIIFFIISCLVVVALYFLGSSLFESWPVGLLSACVFIGFSGFGRHAASGPRAKSLMLLFVILTLLLTSKKKWFWAGVCGSLAFLTWQPTAIYVAISIFLAFIQSESRYTKVKSVCLASAGALIPMAMISLYFLLKGAFSDLFDGVILFHVKNLERGPFSFLGNLGEPISAVYKAYTIMTIPIILGLFMLGGLYVWRLKMQASRISTLLSQDHFAAFLLSLPLPVLWSFLYFQSYPDFYIFLPYLALGFGWLLYLALEAFTTTADISIPLKKIFQLALCVFLIGGALIGYRKASEKGLVEQRQWARQIENMFDRDSKIVSIGVPEILVLLHRTNPNPYVYIVNGIDNRIDEKTTGGFDGWLKELDKYDPSVIAFGQTRGRFKASLTNWLERHYRRIEIGQWTLFVKNRNPD